MQDYFKYDKIQGGAPLRMKSDSDGVTDGQASNTPLGIKTTAEGIKHFTNWDEIANSLDAQNKARFDDTQPNALRFSMNNARGAFKAVSGGVYPIFRHSGNSSNNPYYKRRQSRVEFEDRWDAEDITILDDMAFVSYPDYTDLHRADLSLQSDNLKLIQQAYFDGPDNGGTGSNTQTVHSTLRFTTNLGRLQQVLSFGETDVTNPSNTALRSLDFASLDNTILKIRFTKGADGRLSYNDGANQFSDQPSGDTSTTSTPEVLYFVYGGVLPEEGVSSDIEFYEAGDQGYVEAPDAPTGIPYLDETNTQFDRTTITSSSDKSPLQDINGNAISGANNKQVVGRFYLVPLGETNDGYKIPVENTVGIQLDITSRWAEESTANYDARKALFTTTFSGDRWPEFKLHRKNYQAYSVGMEEVTLIKVQPVRKCGKVDIYTRKRGIIDAVVGNATTSRAHTLNTNDVIEISSALFDGSQAGYADTHPMNGKKFVKKIDDDTFEIFDDQFFQDQTDTSFLKSTMGINWICISSSYGAIGQSWDYHGTIYSPTGRNGYLSGNTSALENSLSDPAQFFTDKRIDSLFATVPANITESPEGSRTTGVVNIDFRNSFNNPDFAQIIDESVPERFSYESPLSNFQYGPQDFYPYHCSNLVGQPVIGVESDDVKSRESSESSSYTTTPYTGCRFGSSLDVKFSHIDGDSKVYTLAVGERGSDISVDLFGVEESECHIDTYNVDDPQISLEDRKTIGKYGRARHYNSINTGDGPILTENFRKRIMPWYLPYGKTHILAITVDRYGRISDISHMNSLFGGGDEILDGTSSAALVNYRETNPWKAFEKAERSFYIEEDVDDLLDSDPPAAVFERYTQSTTIAETVADDNFQIEGLTPAYTESATYQNVEETLIDGTNDPFVAITEGRGVTVGTGITFHSLGQWGVSRHGINTDDNNGGFVTSVVMCTKLSRGWPFSHADDDLDSHKFKFSIVSADEATAYTDVFMPTVVSDEDSLSSLNVQSFESDELITVAGQAASLQEWADAKIKLDVILSIVCDTEEKRLAGTYKMHEFSANLSISEVSDSTPPNLNIPISSRSYRSDELFSEPSYWLDVNSRYTTKYWLRAAALHWYPQNIYGYNYNMTPSEDLVNPSQIPCVRSFNTHSYTESGPGGKTLPIIRRDVTFTQAGNPDISMSRFGDSGFTATQDTPEFFDINRFSRVGESISSGEQAGPAENSNLISNNSQWYMFPWVDSFGKSVALQHTDDGVYVLSGCRSRANEELNAGYLTIDGLNPVPLQPSNFSSKRHKLPQLVTSDTESRIGHINVALLRDRVLYMLEFNELNSGGTVFTRNFVGGNSLESSTSDTGDPRHASVKYLQLPVGTDAGLGMPEVINSAELSNSQIVWKDNYILFSEQDLYNLKSLLHVFKYDSTNGFIRDDGISVPFIDSNRGAGLGDYSNWPRNVCPAYNVGDGFGLHFRYDKDLLISNGMQSIDQLGDDITTKMFASNLNLPQQQPENPSRIDALSVYERRLESGERKLKFVQNIYPSIDANNQEQYPRSLTMGLRCAPFGTDYNYKYLVPLHTLTYDNAVSNPLVWNINWTGRYDVVGTKIIIKDPLEYSLYSSTFTDRFVDPTLTITSTNVNLSSYLTFTEYVEAKTDSLSSFAKYTYDNVSKFTSSDSCGGGWVSGRDRSVTQTPVMFFNVPLKNLDVIDSLTITFNISNQSALMQEWLIPYGGDQSFGPLSIPVNTLVPKIVLYKKDPRSTIILNGPSDSGSRDAYFPHYENGIFKTIPRATENDLNFPLSSAYFSTSNNQFGLYNDQHQAFFRGGAADLFFYGTLPASIVNSAQQNISDAIAAGYPNISLPFYYGGGKNLGEYFDLSHGSHGSAGLPAWISNDTLDSPFLQDNKLGFSIIDNTTSPLIFSSENLKLIEPYAKLFTPVIDGDSVSLTISAADLRDFIIDGSLIKSSTNDRPIFGNRPDDTEYPEIYNDTLASPGFDDINKASYKALDNMAKSIAIGFVMTNVNYPSIGSDPTVENGDLAIRTINRGQADELEPITGEKRYPYSAIANKYSENIKETVGALDFDFSTDVSNVTVNAGIRTVKPTRYSNKFHKIAVFDYHQESSDDIKSSSRYNPDSDGINPDGSIGFSNTQFIEPFARSKFSPLTVGLSNSAQNLNRSRFGEYNFNFVGDEYNTSIFNTQYHGILQSENSIVRFSNTSEAPLNSGAMISSTAMQDSPGSYAKSIQILNSENLSYNDSSYYVNIDDNTPTFILPPTGHILGESFFSRSSLLGGFDVYDPEFVPLFVGSIQEHEQFSDLFAQGMDFASGIVPLKTKGEEMLADDIPLKIGVAFGDENTSLFTYGPEFNQLPLFIIERPPSGLIPLTVSGPDATNSLSLLVNTPVSGGRPLYTQGPVQSQVIHPSQSGLFTRGRTDHNFNTSMFIPTFGSHSGNPSLYIEHGLPDEAQIPLILSPGFSGTPPLFMLAPTPATGSMPLYAESPEPSNSGISLYVDPFGGVSGLPNLFTKGPIGVNENTVLFTGPRASAFDILPLYITTPQSIDSNAHLFTQCFKYTSDSNIDGNEGELIFRYRDGLLLDGDNTEQTITKTISNSDDAGDVQEISSNSITYPTLYDIDGINSSIRFPANLWGNTRQRIYFMGTHTKGLYNTNNIDQPSTFDPIYNTKVFQDSNNRLHAWYRDLATKTADISYNKHVVRDDMFDSNGKYIVVASQGHIFSGSATGGMIAIYEINTDGSLSFDTRLNTVYFDLMKAAASSEVLGTVGGVDIVDGFYSLRQELYDHIIAGVGTYVGPESNSLDYTSGTTVKILNIAISKQGKCAISLRGFFNYVQVHSYGQVDSEPRTYTTLKNQPRDIIIEFDILDYISSEQGFATNQVTACIHDNYTSGTLFRDPFMAYGFYPFHGNSLSYCGETLYYSTTVLNTSIIENEYIHVKSNSSASYTHDYHKREGQPEWVDSEGNIWTTEASAIAWGIGESVQRLVTVAKAPIQSQFHPDIIPDAQLYLDNQFKLNDMDKITGFGYVIKCFDRYNTNDKIIFVSAPLFDPYLNVSDDRASYRVNPMGAVYIFIQSLGSDDWTYQGAVYAKGFTSANIASNLGQYKDGRVQSEFALFGYDLDYKQDVLVVSEPGGNSTGTTNDASAGRCYRFDLTDPAAPLLLNTYEAANLRKDPTDATSAAIDVNDNFGSSVVLSSKKDVITWSDANIQKEVVGAMTVFKNDSTLYNLNTGRYFGFQNDAGVTYDTNLLNEVKNYFPLAFRNLNPENIRISSRILVMKKLKFGDNTKLGILREFTVKSSMLDSAINSFQIHKLSIVEFDKINGLTLFIKGPTGAVSDMPLVNKSITTANSESTLMIPVHFVDFASGDYSFGGGSLVAPSLYIKEASVENNIPLLLKSTMGVSPLYQSGAVVPVNNDISLFLPVIDKENDASLHIHGLGTMSSLIAQSPPANPPLIIGGSYGAEDVAPAPLFIGQEVHKNDFVDLFIQNQYTSTTPDGSGLFNQSSISISGGIFNPGTTQNIGTGLSPSLDLQGPPFFVAGPASASGVLKSPLYITTDIPPTGTKRVDPDGSTSSDDMFLHNANISLFMSTFDGSGDLAQDGTLLIKQRQEQTGTISLYIDRDQAVATTVFVSGVGVGTGVMPLSLEATYENNEEINLFISPVPAVGTTLTSRGFVE